MQLRIRSITYLAEDINGYEFVDPNGHDLPRFAAGAHVGVRLGDAGTAGAVKTDCMNLVKISEGPEFRR